MNDIIYIDQVNGGLTDIKNPNKTAYIRSDLVSRIDLNIEKSNHFEHGGELDDSFNPPCDKCIHNQVDSNDYPCAACNKI